MKNRPRDGNNPLPFLPPAAAAALVLIAACLCGGGQAEARDPTYASYSADSSRLFWFIHITDSHVGWPFTSEPNLKLLVETGAKIIKPSFIVNTGDLTDAGFMAGYWKSYAQILQAAGQNAKSYFDIPGNHDAWLDSKLKGYLAYSIQGQATGKAHHSWLFSFPFGTYQIIGLDTSSGSLPQDEVTFSTQALQAGSGSRLTLVCGHHPHTDIDKNGAYRKLLAKEKVLAYFFGHTHTTFAGGRDFTSDGVLMWVTRSLGKPIASLLEGEFTLFAIDNDGLGVRPVVLKVQGASTYKIPWPIVMITAPLDQKLGGTNPYAFAVSQVATDNPIRALVFADTQVSSVTASVDKSAPITLTNLYGPLYQGTFDGKLLSTTSTTHTLSVTAQTVSTSDTQTIYFSSSSTSACSDGVDNDGDKLIDYPADPGCTGLFDTDERDPPGTILPYFPDGSLAADAGAGDAGHHDGASGSDATADGPDAALFSPADSQAGCDCALVPGCGDGLSFFALLFLLIRRRRTRRSPALSTRFFRTKR